jgi:hypothetical protein
MVVVVVAETDPRRASVADLVNAFSGLSVARR